MGHAEMRHIKKTFTPAEEPVKAAENLGEALQDLTPAEEPAEGSDRLTEAAGRLYNVQKRYNLSIYVTEAEREALRTHATEEHYKSLAQYIHDQLEKGGSLR